MSIEHRALSRQHVIRSLLLVGFLDLFLVVTTFIPKVRTTLQDAKQT